MGFASNRYRCSTAFINHHFPKSDTCSSTFGGNKRGVVGEVEGKKTDRKEDGWRRGRRLNNGQDGVIPFVSSPRLPVYTLCINK